MVTISLRNIEKLFPAKTLPCFEGALVAVLFVLDFKQDAFLSHSLSSPKAVQMSSAARRTDGKTHLKNAGMHYAFE